jgi:hypothetical protein
MAVEVIEVGGECPFLQENFIFANVQPDLPNVKGHIDAFCMACDL